MDYITISIISVAVTAIVMGTIMSLITRSGKQREKEQDDYKDTKYLKEIIYRDRQIKEQHNKIDNLNKTIDCYLSFMVKVPTVVQRLNSTLKIQEIILSTIELVTEVLRTDKVELYMLDTSDNFLKKLTANGKSPEEQVSYPLGEDFVGVVAKKSMLMMREHYIKFYSHQEDGKNSQSQLWMAAPIIFRDKLLGVIGIGEIDKPIGNESNLLKMIADITGVALDNCTTFSKVQHEANTDSLTGLYNRNFFFQISQQLVERSIRDGSPISIFLFDIDNFKHYNDTNGHHAGDKLLIELSQLVRDVSRKESIVARYGGEEFIVMLPRVSKQGAFIYAERLREKISLHPFPYGGKQPLGYMSISGGVASFPEDGDSLYKVTQLADGALYQAKSEGKNRVILHKPLFIFSHEEKEIERANFESSPISQV